MIREMTLEGVRSFIDRTPITFAPLTVLAGANSSGKSTVLQTILLLKQTLELSSANAAALFLSGAHASAGSYKEWSSQHEGGPIRISLTIQQPFPAWNLDAHFRNSGIARVWSWRPSPWRQVSMGARSDAPSGGQLAVTLECQFEEPKRNRAAADLVNATWTLSNVGPESTTEGARTTLSVRKEPSPGPLWAHGVDISPRVPFRVELDGEQRALWQPARAMRCSVEGLIPTTVLTESRDPAFVSTLFAAVEAALKDVAGTVAPQLDDSVRRVDRTLAAALRPLMAGPNVERLIERVSALSDEEFASHVATSARSIARALVGGRRGAGPREAVRKDAAEPVARLYHTQLVSRIMSRRRANVPTEASKAYGFAKEIAQRVVRSRFAGEVLIAYLEQPSTSPARERVTGLLARAADEMASGEPERAFRSLEELSGDLFPNVPPPTVLRRVASEFMSYLGPLRDEPRSLYQNDLPRGPDDVGRRGERAVACLRHFGGDLVLSPPIQAAPDEISLEEITLKDAVNKWGQFLGIFSELDIDTSTEYGASCRVCTGAGEQELSSDLSNVGVGVSQLLPILVLCLGAPLGSIIMIEQPELHLHPSVQTRLAMFFAAIAVTGRQVIVETHSEQLINGLRLHIARSRLRPHMVSLLFASRDRFGTRLKRIEIESDGRIPSWPEGFFDEDERTFVELMRARRERVGKGK